MKKRVALTSPVNGHSHTLSTANMDGSEARRGTTSYVDGHAHDWIMDEAGNLELGHAQGHSHGIGAIVMKQGMEKSFACKVTKVDAGLGLVFGFAVICLKSGEKYFDLQNEHVPESVMLDFATDFMKNSRSAKAMHDGEDVGEVVYAFPLTTEIAKAMDIETKTTGLMIGMAPSKDVLAKFEKGEYTGFSIGGYAMYQDADADESAVALGKAVDLEDENADAEDNLDEEDVCQGCEDGCPECEPKGSELETVGKALRKAIRHKPAGPGGGQFMPASGGGGGSSGPSMGGSGATDSEGSSIQLLSRVRVVGNVQGRGNSGVVKDIAPSGSFVVVRMRGKDVSYNTADLKVVKPTFPKPGTIGSSHD